MAMASTSTNTKIKFEESDESISSDDEENLMEKELADVTFEELQKARSDGSDMVHRSNIKLSKRPTRANKNRPMEMSTKMPVKRFREVVPVPKKVVRDPRFESLCGNLNVEGFKKRYNFIYEDTLPAEKEELTKQMKKTNNPEVKNEIKNHVAQIDKELKNAIPKRTEKDIISEHKKKERKAAQEGKQPYYLKKSDAKKQKLIEQYNQLKASGKLEAFMEKRSKKNTRKDKRYVPYRRPADE